MGSNENELVITLVVVAVVAVIVFFNRSVNQMIRNYLIMRIIDIGSVLIILRCAYFLFIAKSDPIKAIKPRFVDNWFKTEVDKQEVADITKDLG